MSDNNGEKNSFLTVHKNMTNLEVTLPRVHSKLLDKSCIIFAYTRQGVEIEISVRLEDEFPQNLHYRLFGQHKMR